MKHGIIMEQHPNYTIIMTKDGDFLKVKKITNWKIGDEVSYEPYVEERKILLFLRKTPTQMLALAACVLLFVMLPIYFFMDKQHTLAYVNIDINPSIEIEIDKNFKVDAIRSLNQDAELIVKDLTYLKQKNIEEAVVAIMKTCEDNGLLNTGKNMLVGVSYYSDTDEQQVSSVKERINQVVNEQKDWDVTAYSVPAQVRTIANEKKTSVNQVMANKIKEKDEVIVKIFDEDNSEGSHKKEMITSFYTKKENEQNTPPEKEQVNDQSQSQKNHDYKASQGQNKHLIKEKMNVNEKKKSLDSEHRSPNRKSSERAAVHKKSTEKVMKEKDSSDKEKIISKNENRKQEKDNHRTSKPINEGRIKDRVKKHDDRQDHIDRKKQGPKKKEYKQDNHGEWNKYEKNHRDKGKHYKNEKGREKKEYRGHKDKGHHYHQNQKPIRYDDKKKREQDNR